MKEITFFKCKNHFFFKLARSARSHKWFSSCQVFFGNQANRLVMNTMIDDIWSVSGIVQSTWVKCTTQTTFQINRPEHHVVPTKCLQAYNIKLLKDSTFQQHVHLGKNLGKKRIERYLIPGHTSSTMWSGWKYFALQPVPHLPAKSKATNCL